MITKNPNNPSQVLYSNHPVVVEFFLHHAIMGEKSPPEIQESRAKDFLETIGVFGVEGLEMRVVMS